MLADSQTTLSPVNVIEGHGYNLVGTQSIRGNQQKHRVVSQSHGRGSVNGSQKGTDHLPRQGAWQSLGPVQALHINLAVQPCANPPLYGEESKEYSECADVVLEGCGAPTFASTGDVGFEVAAMHLLELDSFFIQVPEKTLRCTPPL